MKYCHCQAVISLLEVNFYMLVSCHQSNLNLQNTLVIINTLDCLLISLDNM